MFIELAITLLLITFVALFFILRQKKHPIICFVGPHSSGKTCAILSILKMTNATVTTLSDHKITYEGRSVMELVPKDSTNDFVEKFRLEEEPHYIFFVKNIQELESFPELPNYRITYVYWKKTAEESSKDVIYLDESREKLVKLIMSF